MKNQTVTMKELPLSERPYELLEAKGEAALTDAQLLAILLRTGSAGEKALDLSLRILSSIPTKGQSPLVALLQQPLTSLRSFKGVGRVKAIQIRALAELVRRASPPAGGAAVNRGFSGGHRSALYGRNAVFNQRSH